LPGHSSLKYENIQKKCDDIEQHMNELWKKPIKQAKTCVEMIDKFMRKYLDNDPKLDKATLFL